MSTQENTQTSSRASTWLKPEQVEQLRDAAYETSHPHLQARNEALVVFLYDTGLRISEALAVQHDGMLDLTNGLLTIPSSIQKDYPMDDQSPPSATLELDRNDDLRTVRTLRSYLNGRWKDTPYLFPSQEDASMTDESVRNVLRQLAEQADVRPYKVDGTRGSPHEVRPHSLRHSVAWRMLAREDARLIDVRNRLRHTKVSTTEEIYEHFQRR